MKKTVILMSIIFAAFSAVSFASGDAEAEIGRASCRERV